jgi:5-methylcytosine-specific restriction endonuclease McrA
MSERSRQCPGCELELSEDCYRARARVCVWCSYGDMTKRATARYRDRVKSVPHRLNVSLTDFVAWYVTQEDQCAYCGLTFEELRRLRVRRVGGYYVSWDVDRVDPKKPYELGNLALSCFVCNMAKGEWLTPEETRTVGMAVRAVWRQRLASLEVDGC